MREKNRMMEQAFDVKKDRVEASDAMIMKVGRMIVEDERKRVVINEKRVKQVEFAYEIMKHSVNKEVEVVCELHRPFNSVGAVSVTGKQVRILEPLLFAEVFDLADNFEVYTKVDGTIRFDFAFHRLTRKEEEQMSFLKCYDVVSMMTEEAEKKFGVPFTENRKRKRDLKECCKMMDGLAEKYDGSLFEAEVDEETKDIIVALVCHEFETTSRGIFCELVRRAKEVRFEKYKEEQIRIEFVFAGIWEMTGNGEEKRELPGI